MVLVMLERRPIELECKPESARIAKEWLRQGLRGQPEIFLQDCLIVVSELTTNAVRHVANGTMYVHTYWVPRGLVIEVRDRSRKPPMIKHPFVGDQQGRGLVIVAELSESWGYTLWHIGKSVWAIMKKDYLRQC
jgi:anti-sigma regulatory factor (Ser/Thr protein kinase)